MRTVSTRKSIRSRSGIPSLPLSSNRITLVVNSSIMFSYDTVSEAVNGLKKRGFDLDFNLEENCLVCNGDKFEASKFEIVEVYRFEGNTDPSDEAVVYAIESSGGVKGVLVSGYGISAEGMSAEMAKKLSIHKP